MVAVAAVVVAVMFAGASASGASGGALVGGSPAAVAETTMTTTGTPQGSDTTERLPGTTLEAQARDDGTSPAVWLIGSGIAAAAAVAIGGTVLKRRAG